MKINTKYHGERVIEEKEVINFPHGIPGFLEEKEFILLPIEENGAFFALQSITNKHLAFVITNPFLFINDYDFELEDHVIELLELESEKDVLVFSILTVQDPFEKTTINIKAPIVMNSKNNKAKQVILNIPAYKTKHPLFGKFKHELVKG